MEGREGGKETKRKKERKGGGVVGISRKEVKKPTGSRTDIKVKCKSCQRDTNEQPLKCKPVGLLGSICHLHN